jgi:hypothetical protein
MVEELSVLKSDLLPALAAEHLTNFRLGLVLYKDYGAAYLTRVTPLSADFAAWSAAVSRSEASGGGDIPEAVIEALDAGSSLFDSASTNSKLIVDMADAPQHDSPRGQVRESDVLGKLAKNGISLQLIMFPLAQ